MTVTIGRRELLVALGGAAATWPLVARAQQGEKIRRIDILMPYAANDLEGQTMIAGFLQGLQQLGWSDGRNVRIDTRWVAGDAERVRRYAAESIALAPDIILAAGAVTVAPLLQATVPLSGTYVGNSEDELGMKVEVSVKCEADPRNRQ